MSAIKEFFENLFNKIDKLYRGLKPDSAEGKYIADMRKTAKKLKDMFVEGLTAASEKKSVKKSVIIEGIGAYSEKEIASIESNKKFVVAKSFGDVISFFENSIIDKSNETKLMFIGKFSEETSSKIYSATGLDAENKSIALSSSDIRHMIKAHGNPKTENLRGQEAITVDNFEKIIKTIAQPDSVSSETDKKSGVVSVIFKKEIDGKTTAITIFSEKKKAFTLKTARITKKEQHISQPVNAKALTSTPKAKSSMNAVSINSISQPEQNVNSKKTENIKQSARSKNMSAGQIEKLKANYTHEKVYSKKSALDIISRFNGVGDLKGKTREAIAESIWKD